MYLEQRDRTRAAGTEEAGREEGEGDGLVEEIDAMLESGLDQVLDRVALNRSADRKPSSIRESAV